MNRCVECRFWHPFGGSSRRVGSDLADRQKLGACGRISDAFDADRKATHLALVEDMSGCCGLRTDADFGCVLWEAK
jgi:hypothetical protein